MLLKSQPDRVLARRNGQEQRESDIGAEQLAAGSEGRSDERQDRNNAEQHSGPENPREEPAPTRLGAVREDAHDGIEECAPDPHHQSECVGGGAFAVELIVSRIARPTDAAHAVAITSLQHDRRSSL